MPSDKPFDACPAALRPERFFHSNVPMRNISGWFYIAREGTFGPFATQEDARRSLAELINMNPLRRDEIYPHHGRDSIRRKRAQS